jgi:hypothetical protein
MSIVHRNILGKSLTSPGSSDGASTDPQTDPWTGAPNPGYQAPRSSAPVGSHDQFDGPTTSRLQSIEADHMRASRASTNIDVSDNCTGCGEVVGGDAGQSRLRNNADDARYETEARTNQSGTGLAVGGDR